MDLRCQVGMQGSCMPQYLLISFLGFSLPITVYRERDFSQFVYEDMCNRLNKQPGFLNQEDLSGILNILYSLSVDV